jgi:hypothetical protein
MNDKDFQIELLKYGRLIPIRTDSPSDKTNNSTLPTKIELHPVINDCMLNGCGRKVVDQVIDITKINGYYRKHCSICKHYQHPNQEELVSSYHELINIEKPVEHIHTGKTHKKVHKNSISGHRNICYRKNRESYIVSITVNGRKKYIGYYKTLSEAIIARDDAEKLHNCKK